MHYIHIQNVCYCSIYFCVNKQYKGCTMNIVAVKLLADKGLSQLCWYHILVY